MWHCLHSLFKQEEIDTLESVAMLTEDDLKEMNIKIGPRRKIWIAVQQLVDDLPLAEAVAVETKLNNEN